MKKWLIFGILCLVLAMGVAFILAQHAAEHAEIERLKDMGRQNLLRNAIQTYIEETGKLPSPENAKLVKELSNAKIKGNYYFNKSDFIFNRQGEIVDRFGAPLWFTIDKNNVVISASKQSQP